MNNKSLIIYIAIVVVAFIWAKIFLTFMHILCD